MRRDAIIFGINRLLFNINETGVVDVILRGPIQTADRSISDMFEIYSKLMLYYSTAGEAEHSLISEF
jgi:hypothetical protein